MAWVHGQRISCGLLDDSTWKDWMASKRSWNPILVSYIAMYKQFQTENLSRNTLKGSLRRPVTTMLPDFLSPDVCSYTICESPFWLVAVLLHLGSHPPRGPVCSWVLNSIGHISVMI